MPLTQHPQRVALHNEVHARPPQALVAPLALSHVVMVGSAASREASRAHLAALLRDLHLPLPDAQQSYFRMDLGRFQLRWELHTEFVSWTFLVPLGETPGTAGTPARALDAVPQDWFAGLPGECLVSLNLWVLGLEAQTTVRQQLQEDHLVGAAVAGGSGQVYTDFMIHPDGASRMVLLAGAMSTRRLGRLVQRLIEIETYRMAALLGLPAARAASSVLGDAERELAELAGAIRSARREDEPLLLDRLTRLAGAVESQHATTHSRFSASAAYFELVDKRIRDIQESPLPGLQTLGQFMDRRLNPARSTCEWATRRQDALSQRVARISDLLRTRVEIEQQQSSQALLTTMNQRQGLQLKLQSTVEGLSVAAITYYIAGLVSYIAKGAQPWGWPWSAEGTAAVAVPVVALGVWWSLRRLHRRVFGA
ncbi:MAG: DUF3422 domain-containing protein [Rhodoferax sp.]|nr:DUF3422 domain-containing protein [Rhodoferax sp.]